MTKYAALFLSWIAVSSGEKGVAHLYIIHTNDIHGALAPSAGWWMNPYFPPPIGNAPAAAAFIKEKRDEARSKKCGFVLLDGGDIFQGTPIGELGRGKIMAEYYNYLGYDAVVVGNHDYDFGPEALTELVNSTGATFLGANVVNEGSEAWVNYLKPFIILEQAGVRIGIFGITTQYLEGMTTADRFRGHDVLHEVKTARRCVAALKAKGVDLIVGLTHIGLLHDQQLADSVAGIDIIIGGHSHTGLPQPYEDSINHTLIFQTYGRLSNLGFIDIKIDKGTRRIAGFRSEIVDLLAEEIDEDTVMARMISQWEDESMKGLDEVIGVSLEELTRAGMQESPLGNLITDAMREYFDVDLAIHNSGGIRASLPKGEVTYRDCFNIDAFSNTAVVMKLSGRQLREIFEVSINGHHAIFQVSGLKVKYDSDRPALGRIAEIIMDSGSPLADDKAYRVATNSYLAAGAGEYRIFREGKDIEDSYTFLRDIIAGYIRKHSPILKGVEGRIVDIRK